MRIARITAFVVMAALAFGATACKKEEGPAEKVGKALDQAVEDTKDAAAEAKEEAREALDE
jgi:predicted SpoU family rRNA methylase